MHCCSLSLLRLHWQSCWRIWNGFGTRLGRVWNGCSRPVPMATALQSSIPAPQADSGGVLRLSAEALLQRGAHLQRSDYTSVSLTVTSTSGAWSIRLDSPTLNLVLIFLPCHLPGCHSHTRHPFGLSLSRRHAACPLIILQFTADTGAVASGQCAVQGATSMANTADQGLVRPLAAQSCCIQVRRLPLQTIANS